MYNLIVPMGILTYVSLVLAAATGFAIFKFHIKWVKLKLHIFFAVLALIFGALHAGLVITLH